MCYLQGAWPMLTKNFMGILTETQVFRNLALVLNARQLFQCISIINFQKHTTPEKFDSLL